MSIPNQAVELAEKLSSSFLQEGGSDGFVFSVMLSTSFFI